MLRLEGGEDRLRREARCEVVARTGCIVCTEALSMMVAHPLPSLRAYVHLSPRLYSFEGREGKGGGGGGGG